MSSLIDRKASIASMAKEYKITRYKYKKLEDAWLRISPNYLELTDEHSSIILDELAEIKTGQTIIDIGSGHGSLGLYLAQNKPYVKYYGYEFMKNRIDVAIKSLEKIKKKHNTFFFKKDLTSDELILPVADYYYFYYPNKDIEFYKKVCKKITNKKHRIIFKFYDLFNDKNYDKMSHISDNYRLIKTSKCCRFFMYESITH